MSDEELNELEHAARTSVAGGLAWRLGKALASVRAERDEQESEKNAERDALCALLREAREYTGYAAHYGDSIEADHAADLCARIDAALNTGGMDE